MQSYNQKKYAFASDYIRLDVLNRYGGVYLDTDVELVRSIDELLTHKTVIGFENDGTLESNFIASEKNRPWLEMILSYYLSTDFVKENGKLNTLPNTWLITAFLRKYFGLKIANKNQLLKDDIMVFANNYFSPKDLTTRKILMTDNTYSIHHFDASWVNKNFDKQQRFLRSIKRIVGKNVFGWFTCLSAKLGTKKLFKKI